MATTGGATLTALGLGLAILSTPTRFGVDTTNGVSWLTNRAHQRFLSMGVCCVGEGLKPAEYLATNPGYAALRMYPSQLAWVKATQKRLPEWGFNTIGAWSEHPELRGSLYQTPVLHLGSVGIPWVDMWDPKVVAAANQLALDEITRWKADPNIIGYFSDNELGWWYGAMFEWAWKSTPAFGTRDRLVDLLQKAYPTWDAVLVDFDPEGADGFEGLRKSGRLFLRPGGNGMVYVRAVMRMLAARYYGLCRTAIKTADPTALFLGDRYISNFYPEVASEAGKYADVVSTNLNAGWPDGGLYHFYLDELHRMAKKPIMITEFYECAMENRSGNMNDSSGFPSVRTQRERAAGVERQLRQMIAKPYVVGAHWFQFYDEPQHGRGDGENYNMGLVDIRDKPYAEVTEVFRRFPVAKVHRLAKPAGRSTPKIDAIDARNLSTWPRDGAYVPPSSGDARGDLYVAWHPSGLFVGLAWDEDRYPENFYRSGSIPSADRAVLTLNFPHVKPVKAIVGLGGEMQLEGANAIFHESGTRNAAIFRIPTNAFGRANFRAGEVVPFTATFSTRGRTYRMAWSGSLHLRP